VPKVVAWHHHVTRAYEEGPRWASMTSVLRLADLLAYSLASDNDEAEVERAARSESASYLDISAAQLAAIWDELRNLHERSRALFRGEEPPQELPQVSLRPATRIGRPSASKGLRHSHPSLRPPTLRGLAGLSGIPSSGGGGRSLQVAAPIKVQIKEAPEGPKQFPCVVCKGPSFANVCLACHGYVCPDHQRGPEQWCELCRGEFATESYGVRLRPILILMLGAGLGATLVGVLASAASGRGLGSTALLVGPLLGTGFAAGLVAIFHRYAHRAWFLRTRTDRSVAAAAHVSTPLPPGMTKEKIGSGLRDATRPIEPQGLESIFAQSSSDDLRIRSEAPPSSRGLALAGTSAVGDAGPSFSARVFASSAPAAGDARESLPVRGVSNRASAPLEGQVASLVPSRSIAIGPASNAASPAAAYPSGIPASLAPSRVAARAESLAPASFAPAAASLPPLEGASAFPPEASSREAAERGRTLRLLSEHSSSNPPVSGRTAAPARAASSAPQISVRPVVDADARTLHFPDWSEPPAPRQQPGEAPPATAEPEVAARVATKGPQSPVVDTPVRANTAVRSEQAWSLVLQATGTADGW
jgi:hypothetical protein